MTIQTAGIDLGKDKMHLVGLDANGEVVARREFGSRTALIRYLAKCCPCRVAMEACAGAHYVGRKAAAMEHEAKLLPGQYVRAYRKSQKNDYADGEAIAEAATRPTMREVQIKEASQQELQLLHRQRTGWVSQRTATVNRIRAMLLEFGITMPKSIDKVRSQLPLILEDADNGVPDLTRSLLYELWRDVVALDERVDWATKQLERMARADPRARALLQIPGVGVIIATATIAAIGDGRAFRRGRDFGAWLGLVPKQYSTGGKTRLLGIGHTGNRYLRTILIQGARSAFQQFDRRDDPLARWAKRLRQRKPDNVSVVALANKLARVILGNPAAAGDVQPRHGCRCIVTRSRSQAQPSPSSTARRLSPPSERKHRQRMAVTGDRHAAEAVAASGSAKSSAYLAPACANLHRGPGLKRARPQRPNRFA